MSNSFNFTYSIKLDDLDYMGIVGNANWLIILERARINLLEHVGFPFFNFSTELKNILFQN